MKIYGRCKGGEQSEPPAASRPSDECAERVILLVHIKLYFRINPIVGLEIEKAVTTGSAGSMIH